MLLATRKFKTEAVLMLWSTHYLFFAIRFNFTLPAIFFLQSVLTLGNIH